MKNHEKIVVAGITAIAVATVVYLATETIGSARVNRARRKLMEDMRETNAGYHRVISEINDKIDQEKFEQIIRDNDL